MKISSIAEQLSATTQLECVYADDDCIVINKPSGLHTVPGIGADKQDSVLTRLQHAMHPQIFAAHRLDRDTSGLVVFGCHKQALASLGRQFEAKTIVKRYSALVSGLVKESAGEVCLTMCYSEAHKPRQIVSPDGKFSHTQWRRVSCQNNTTLMTLEPITGRTHQLRLHMQQLGHAIVGDQLYADADWANAASRLCLHAAELQFNHPISEQPMRFVRPESFQQVMLSL